MEPTFGPQGGEEAAALFAGCFFIFFLVFGLLTAAITVVCYCKIFQKAGFHWALGLLMLVPLANFIMLLYLAFGKWPIHEQLQAFRIQINTGAG